VKTLLSRRGQYNKNNKRTTANPVTAITKVATTQARGGLQEAFTQLHLDLDVWPEIWPDKEAEDHYGDSWFAKDSMDLEATLADANGTGGDLADSSKDWSAKDSVDLEPTPGA
jgi:hypothetical protein